MCIIIFSTCIIYPQPILFVLTKLNEQKKPSELEVLPTLPNSAGS